MVGRCLYITDTGSVPSDEYLLPSDLGLEELFLSKYEIIDSEKFMLAVIKYGIVYEFLA